MTNWLGWDLVAFHEDQHVLTSEYLVISALLLVASLALQHMIGAIWKLTFLPEATASMLLGMCVGAALRFVYSDAGGDTSSDSEAFKGFHPSVLGFSAAVFYFGFLPPIIFNGGYHLERKLFYANIDGIASLAIVGTSISIAIVSLGLVLLPKLRLTDVSLSVMECIAFGSLISSTDPVSTLVVFKSLKVDQTLFYLVFGESMLNDAIALTIFNTASRFIGREMTRADVIACVIHFVVILSSSTFIGYVFGILSAVWFKWVSYEGKEQAVVAVAIFVGLMYIPFFMCEMLQLRYGMTKRYIYMLVYAYAYKLFAYTFQCISV
jgi:sodium/hydrogen exchanger 8